jgi:hypothetical protein
MKVLAMYRILQRWKHTSNEAHGNSFASKPDTSNDKKHTAPSAKHGSNATEYCYLLVLFGIFIDRRL